MKSPDDGTRLELARFVRLAAIGGDTSTSQTHLREATASAAKHDGEAMAALLRAEQIAPQRVRLSPLVPNTVGVNAAASAPLCRRA
jgi:hypothetical protein